MSSEVDSRVLLLVKRALDARASRDWSRAASLAAELCARCPEHPAGFKIGASAAHESGRLDEAAALVREGMARFPAEAWPLVQAAWSAKRLGDTSEATRLSVELRQRFPENPGGYHIAACIARESGRLDEAQTLLSEGISRFPTQAWPVLEAAWLAKCRDDTREATRLSVELRQRFPENPGGYHIAASIARESGRLDEAAAIFGEASIRFPSEAWPLVEALTIAKERGQIDVATQLAGDLRGRFPNDSAGYVLGSRLLSQWSRPEEAEAILRTAIARFPTQEWPGQELAAQSGLRTYRGKATQLVARLVKDTPAILAAAKRPVNPGKVIVVLGMHRSGTSLCAQILQQLGVALGGPLMSASFDNPDGFQEHLQIVECHEMLLKVLGSAYDSIRLVSPVTATFWDGDEIAAVRTRLKDIVAEQLVRAGGVWAFKDPRTLRFLPVWKDVFDELGIRPVWVLTVRDPRAVAASLQVREGLPPALGELVWVEHYLDALRHLGPSIDAIVHYERWFSAFDAQIRLLAETIGGAPIDAVEKARKSIKVALRHHIPNVTDHGLDLAREIHSRLLNDSVNLADLQHEAHAIWRDIEAKRPQG